MHHNKKTTPPPATFETLCGRAWQPYCQVSAALPCPTKICTNRFLSNRPFNTKCIIIKRQPHPHVVFATLCGNDSSVITLFQSTVSWIWWTRLLLTLFQFKVQWVLMNKTFPAWFNFMYNNVSRAFYVSEVIVFLNKYISFFTVFFDIKNS
jgi:hypothetical protein